ncbi:Uncharacterised protein [uncultured archaeon]|nr:Uncharacterised protein [uncultured archaeon]
MKNETYVWISILIIIAVAALSFRYLYQPTLSVELGMNGSAAIAGLYPYQNAALPITIYNSGSGPVKNLSIGVFVNGNLTTLYKITLPSGKQTVIPFNYSPTEQGTYNITATADPSKLYAISNREKATSAIVLTVKAPDNESAYGLLPLANVTLRRDVNLRHGGYLTSTYIGNEYNDSGLSVIDNKKVGGFIGPLLNLTAYYINNMTVSSAKYVNGDSAYAIWIRGYINPDVISFAANASGLRHSSIMTASGNMTFVRVSNDTSLCSWYSGGWLKMLAYVGAKNCSQALSESAASAPSNRVVDSFYGKLMPAGGSVLANYTWISGAVSSSSTLSMLGNSSFVYEGISNNTARDSACYGIVSTTNGTHYCSTYVVPKSNKIGGPYSLIKTTAYIGTYNLTVMSLFNSSFMQTQIPLNINLIREFNISGKSQGFRSGLVNTCSFNQSLLCSNVTFANGTISFRIANNYSSPIRLDSISCFANGASPATELDQVLGAGQAYNATTQCYSKGSVISGIPLNLYLNLKLNYTASANETRVLVGNAHILFG